MRHSLSVIKRSSTRAQAMVLPSPTPRRAVATLLIDNYDSYTFNVYQMLAQVNALEPVVVKNDDFGGDWGAAWAHFLSVTFGRSEGFEQWGELEPIACNVVISPGPGHPAEPADFGMCAEAIRSSPVPVLGVCLGHQGLATVYSGRVTNAPEVMHGRTSRVAFETGVRSPLFDHIPDGFEVVRYHSLAIDERELPSKELQVLARSSGDGVIMAVQHRSKLQFGVQFHPEAVCSTFGFQLFQNFRDITLFAPTSKCALEHSAHPDESIKLQSRADEALQQAGERKYQVTIQKIQVGTASLAFAEQVFGALFGCSTRSFWLDSSNFDANAGSGVAQSRFSIMGDDSGPLSHCVEYNMLEKRLQVCQGSSTEVVSKDVLTYIRESMADFKDHSVASWKVNITTSTNEMLTVENIPFAFRGGYVGYFGYELIGSEIHNHETSILKSTLEDQQRSGERVPDASFLFADRSIVFDHLIGTIYTVCVNTAGYESQSTEWHSETVTVLRDLVADFSEAETAFQPSHHSVVEPVVFFPSRSRDQYGHDIEKIQQLIHDGETYEVCLTNQLRAECSIGRPLEFYKLLRKRNPAPFAGFYLSNPYGSFTRSLEGSMQRSYAICCSSPERFLRVDDDGWMESKPIKGTRPRGISAVEDAEIAQELATCVKDRAENMMIADLVRNDFGVVAQIGSVHVPALMAVESYKTVHQLVTTVRGKKRQDADLVDILRATFPGGSMTGAPKKRTMQIIRDLECGPRGVYSGALGFLSINASCDLNIIIRTAVVTPQSVSLGAGGAIVAMSDTEDEYEEMLLKARALVQTVGCFVTGRDDDTGAKVEVATTS